jgi:hypothetical protein
LTELKACRGLFKQLSFFFNLNIRGGGGVHTGSTRHCGHSWLIVPAPGDCEDGEVGGMNGIGRGNRSTRRKPPWRHFVYHKSHFPDPGAKTGRRGRKPTTNRFSYCAAINNLAYYQYGVYVFFYLMMFVVNNLDKFQPNNSVHGVNTRNNEHVHRPVTHLSSNQRNVYYSGVKLYNSLPTSITTVKNYRNLFRVALRSYLLNHSFYSANEFTTQTKISIKFNSIYFNHGSFYMIWDKSKINA